MTKDQMLALLYHMSDATQGAIARCSDTPDGPGYLDDEIEWRLNDIIGMARKIADDRPLIRLGWSSRYEAERRRKS